MKNANAVFIIAGVLIVILGIFQLTSTQNLSAKNSARYIILNSKLDGVNMSKIDRDRGGVILFEFAGNKEFQLSNISEVDNCGSFGEISNYKSDTAYLGAEKYKFINASFSWNYKNDYDSATGMAYVKFKEKTSAYGTDFVLHMYIEKTGEIIEYSGYKDGTRDAAVLTETVW